MMISIDGSMGEGGGQILRSALTLSLLTGQPFAMTNIRAARKNPGLRPQHLAALHAAQRISRARVEGDRVGSQCLTFAPGPVESGVYHFDIGTAGATALVLQTVLLPLATAAGESQLTIGGGTHVPWSPCFHYLDWHWRRLLAHIGIPFELRMEMAGFFPEGGGMIAARIPGGARPHGIRLTERGGLQRVRGLSAVANLASEIGERQRRQAQRRLQAVLGPIETEIVLTALPARSRGTLLLLLAEFEHSQACFFALGERGKPAERVADEAVDELCAFLVTDGAIDPWLTDQLLLPLALAGDASELRTSAVTQHLLTNAGVIDYFLPVDIVLSDKIGSPSSVVIRPRA